MGVNSLRSTTAITAALLTLTAKGEPIRVMPDQLFLLPGLIQGGYITASFDEGSATAILTAKARELLAYLSI